MSDSEKTRDPIILWLLHKVNSIKY